MKAASGSMGALCRPLHKNPQSRGSTFTSILEGWQRLPLAPGENKLFYENKICMKGLHASWKLEFRIVQGKQGSNK
jgi:hypothetical protein